MAIKWCDFLNLHAKKIYKVDETPMMPSIRMFAKKLKDGKITDGDSIRMIHRHHWTHLKTIEQVMHTIDYLTDLNWIKTEDVSNNRESLVIRINPNLKLRSLE
ncbi:MAG: hypothetical protein HQK53_09310 [Oligoflexia bacterium]|nr:hypothetical protein [Oligoflexia bacterium]